MSAMQLLSKVPLPPWVGLASISLKCPRHPFSCKIWICFLCSPNVSVISCRFELDDFCSSELLWTARLESSRSNWAWGSLSLQRLIERDFLKSYYFCFSIRAWFHRALILADELRFQVTRLFAFKIIEDETLIKITIFENFLELNIMRLRRVCRIPRIAEISFTWKS